MKKILFILMLTFAVAFSQGVKDYDVETFFGSSWDYEQVDGGKYLVSNDAVQDTINGVLYPNGAGADITISGKVLANTGTIDALIEIGLDMGDEYGVDWFTVINVTGETVFKFNFLDQDWGSKQICGRFLIRITENGAQSNKYGIRAHIFKWKD